MLNGGICVYVIFLVLQLLFVRSGLSYLYKMNGASYYISDPDKYAVSPEDAQEKCSAVGGLLAKLEEKIVFDAIVRKVANLYGGSYTDGYLVFQFDDRVIYTSNKRVSTREEASAACISDGGILTVLKEEDFTLDKVKQAFKLIDYEDPFKVYHEYLPSSTIGETCVVPPCSGKEASFYSCQFDILRLYFGASIESSENKWKWSDGTVVTNPDFTMQPMQSCKQITAIYIVNMSAVWSLDPVDCISSLKGYVVCQVKGSLLTVPRARLVLYVQTILQDSPEEARNKCLATGGMLAMFQDTASAQVLLQKVRKLQDSASTDTILRVYIGARSNADQMEWFWSDGKKVTRTDFPDPPQSECHQMSYVLNSAREWVLQSVSCTASMKGYYACQVEVEKFDEESLQSPATSSIMPSTSSSNNNQERDDSFTTTLFREIQAPTVIIIGVSAIALFFLSIVGLWKRRWAPPETIEHFKSAKAKLMALDVQRKKKANEKKRRETLPPDMIPSRFLPAASKLVREVDVSQSQDQVGESLANGNTSPYTGHNVEAMESALQMRRDTFITPSLMSVDDEYRSPPVLDEKTTRYLMKVKRRK